MSDGDGVLVIGYGNPLRGDDGAGWSAAELLAEDPRAAGAQVVICHQLTPELAEDVSRADLVVLIDASAEVTGGAAASRPGAVEVRTIPVAHDDGTASTPVTSLFSHHIDAVRLLQLSGALYGRWPPAVEISIRVADVEGGTALSPPVGAGLSVVVDAVIDAMRTHERRCA